MEEKKPGKRLAVGATKSPGAKRGLIIVGAVAGVDIGGLSFPQAQEKLEQEFSRRAQSLSLTVAGDSQAYPIPIGAVEADVLQAVTDADSWPRAHGFFAQGAYFLKSLIVGHDVEVSVGFTATGEAQVDDILAGIESELGGVVQETTWSVEGGVPPGEAGQGFRPVHSQERHSRPLLLRRHHPSGAYRRDDRSRRCGPGAGPQRGLH